MSKITDKQLAELHESLTARAEEVCRLLLPGGVKVSGKWQCGGVDGGPGKSMSVELVGEKAGVWTDRATGESGRLLKLFELVRGVDFKKSLVIASDFCNITPEPERNKKVDPSSFVFSLPTIESTTPAYKSVDVVSSKIIDWAKHVAEVTPQKAAELCAYRGYSVDMVQWMVENQLVGCYQGDWAFPVKNDKGDVVAIHYKGSKSWYYCPEGATSSALMIGNPMLASHTLAFESQWDAFSVLDKLEIHAPENYGIYAAVVTRSATSNTDFAKLEIPNLIACTQNDPREKLCKDGIIRPTTNKEGRTPSEEWLHRISSSRHKSSKFVVFETPLDYKDANDWIRGENPSKEHVYKRVISESRNPILKGARSMRELNEFDTKNDPDVRMGTKRRYLCKGGSWMIVGPSGVGKSTLITDLVVCAASQKDFYGVDFHKKMRCLVVQDENDEFDIAEMVQGVAGRDFDSMAEILFAPDSGKTGEEFCVWLEEMIRESDAEFVVIDPLLSFFGDDISNQKSAAEFLRHWLKPVIKRTGAVLVVVHHTGKPSKEKVLDISYSGMGSSELVNFCRAVSVLSATTDPSVFKFTMGKRGKRSGMKNLQGEFSDEIFLSHSAGEGVSWFQVPPIDDPEPEKPGKKDLTRFTSKVPKAVKAAWSPQPSEVLLKLPQNFSGMQLFEAIKKTGVVPSAIKSMMTDWVIAKHVVADRDGSFSKPENKLIF